MTYVYRFQPWTILLSQLRQKTTKKMPRKIGGGVRLLQDNAPIYAASLFEATVYECDFTENEHTPYSTNLTLFFFFQNWRPS